MSIVITGNPGVGKHTIAEQVKDLINLPLLDINEFAKECGLLEKRESTNDVDTEELARKLQKKITEPHLIVGHLAPYVIAEIPIKVIVILRRSPRELAAVYSQRKYTEKKSKDNLGSEVLGVIVNDAVQNLGKEKIFQVDVSGKSISECTSTVMAAINNKVPSEKIDWLSKMSSQDLRSFFSYD